MYMESVIWIILISIGMSIMVFNRMRRPVFLDKDLVKNLILGSEKLETDTPYMESFVLTAEI